MGKRKATTTEYASFREPGFGVMEYRWGCSFGGGTWRQRGRGSKYSLACTWIEDNSISMRIVTLARNAGFPDIGEPKVMFTSGKGSAKVKDKNGKSMKLNLKIKFVATSATDPSQSWKGTLKLKSSLTPDR